MIVLGISDSQEAGVAVLWETGIAPEDLRHVATGCHSFIISRGRQMSGIGESSVRKSRFHGLAQGRFQKETR